jgi:hypothetical protein
VKPALWRRPLVLSNKGVRSIQRWLIECSNQDLDHETRGGSDVDTGFGIVGNIVK